MGNFWLRGHSVFVEVLACRLFGTGTFWQRDISARMGTLWCWDISAQEYFDTWTFLALENFDTRKFRHHTKLYGCFGTDILALVPKCVTARKLQFCQNIHGPKCFSTQMYLCRKVPVPKYPGAKMSLCWKVAVWKSSYAKTSMETKCPRAETSMEMKCPRRNVFWRNVRCRNKPKPDIFIFIAKSKNKDVYRLIFSVFYAFL